MLSKSARVGVTGAATPPGPAAAVCAKRPAAPAAAAEGPAVVTSRGMPLTLRFALDMVPENAATAAAAACARALMLLLGLSCRDTAARKQVLLSQKPEQLGLQDTGWLQPPKCGAQGAKKQLTMPADQLYAGAYARLHCGLC